MRCICRESIISHFSRTSINDVETFKQLVTGYVSLDQCAAVLSGFQADYSYIHEGILGIVSVIDSAFEGSILI